VNWPLVMALALALDAAVGWPDALYRRIGHPVTWIGGGIAWFDRRLNRKRDAPARQRAAGVLTALGVVTMAAAPAALIVSMLPDGAAGHLLAAFLSAPFIAARSLDEHVAQVGQALAGTGLADARAAVAHIVGRDPAALDEAGIARASLESLSENSSDGVVAPLLWGALLGLPGLVGYKAINTLDSMIGYRTARHADFGRFSARLDDVVNWPAARVTALVLALAGGRPRTSLEVMRHDALRHRSPNAGWPEAAMAGALGCRLSGPRVYGSGTSGEPWLNEAAPDPGAADIRRGLAVYRRGMLLVGVVLLVLGWGRT
jgi:adenosylcobinamide-phosphate synthase